MITESLTVALLVYHCEGTYQSLVTAPQLLCYGLIHSPYLCRLGPSYFQEPPHLFVSLASCPLFKLATRVFPLKFELGHVSPGTWLPTSFRVKAKVSIIVIWPSSLSALTSHIHFSL